MHSNKGLSLPTDKWDLSLVHYSSSGASYAVGCGVYPTLTALTAPTRNVGYSLLHEGYSMLGQ